MDSSPETPISDELITLFPHLFQETVWPWGPTRVRFSLMDSPPQDRLIGNINIIPRVNNLWLILQLEDGSWEIPGGTLESGEDFLAAARRELREEAGARFVNWKIIGGWHCHSLARQPYKPHLPFPEYYRIVLLGEVEILHFPTNPVGSERVSQVETTSLDTAVSRFRSIGRQDLAELYLLSSKLWKTSNLLKNT